jgi:phospholipid/cholesterol/gamma-HCH transport system substrate-binding protein
MKPLATRDPFKIGLVAILVLALLGLGVVVLSRASFGTRTYTAMLQHTAGLRAGEAVEVHGVVVGNVRRVELDGRSVKVTFTAKRKIELGALTTASVKVATLLGTHYLDVDPSGGCCLSGPIPLDRTSVPYNLQDVLDEGIGKLEDLDPAELAQALTAMADTMGGSQEEIGPALGGIAALSEVITKRGAQTTQLLRAARSVSDQLVRSSPDLVELMKQANLVITEITSRRQAIHTLLVETTTLSKALTAIVEQTKGDLQPALKDVNAVIATLNQQDARLQRALDTMAPAARYVANALGNGPWLSLKVHDPALPADDTLCTLRSDCR